VITKDFGGMAPYKNTHALFEQAENSDLKYSKNNK